MSSPGPSLRFTISRHEKPGEPHFDLFLEMPGSDGLWTWNLRTAPAELPTGAIAPARRIADHRRAYLDFEGEVSGRRGTVRIVETGTLEILDLFGERLRVRLRGQGGEIVVELEQLQEGEWALRRIE